MMFYFLMIRIRKNDKILNAIVIGIAVNMVNMFTRKKFATNVLFHQPSMFSEFFTVNSNGFVFVKRFTEGFKTFICKFFQMNFCQTRSRAKFRVATFNTISWDIKFFFAKRAIKSFSVFRAIFNFFRLSEMKHLTSSGAINMCFPSFLEGKFAI